MQGPTQDWMRAKLFNTRPISLALPQGVTLNRADDEAAVFEVIELGPDVVGITTGSLIIASFMSGMMKFKLPDESESSFAIKETDVIYVIVEGGTSAGIKLT